MRSPLYPLVVVLIGCGSSPRPAVTAPATAAAVVAPRDPLTSALAHAPVGTVAIISLDVPRLAPTRYGKALLGKYDIGGMPEVCRALSAADFGRVTIAVRTGDELVGFASGGVSEARLSSCLAGVVSGKGGRLVTTTVHGQRVYHAEGSPDDNGWLTWLAPDQMVMASSEAVLREVIEPGAARLTGSLLELAQAADHSRMVWAATTISPAQLAAFDGPLPPLAQPLTVLVGLDVGERLDAEVVLGLGAAADPAQAAELGAALERLLVTLRPTMYGPALDDVHIEVVGSEVRVHAHFDEAASALLRSIIKFT